MDAFLSNQPFWFTTGPSMSFLPLPWNKDLTSHVLPRCLKHTFADLQSCQWLGGLRHLSPKKMRSLVRELTAVDEHYSLIAYLLYLCSNLSTAKASGICVLDFCPEIKDHDRCTRSLYFIPSNCIFSLGRINNLDKHHAAEKMNTTRSDEEALPAVFSQFP